MSKRVKALVEKDLEQRLGDVDAVAVINPRGIDAVKTNKIRRKLAENGIRLQVVKNTLARRAGGRIGIGGFEKLLDGPSALVYGVAADGKADRTGISTVCRILIDQKKEKQYETLELRGVFFDGEVYQGEKGVEKVSKFPTREEAIGQILSAILGPGSSIGGALQGPASQIAGILSTIEEKQGEGDEAGGEADGEAA